MFTMKGRNMKKLFRDVFLENMCFVFIKKFRFHIPALYVFLNNIFFHICGKNIFLAKYLRFYTSTKNFIKF